MGDNCKRYSTLIYPSCVAGAFLPTVQTEEIELSFVRMDVIPSVKADRKMMQWALPTKPGIWESSYRNLQPHHRCEGNVWPYGPSLFEWYIRLVSIFTQKVNDRCSRDTFLFACRILTVRVCPAVWRPLPLTSRSVFWFSPVPPAALSDTFKKINQKGS